MKNLELQQQESQPLKIGDYQEIDFNAALRMSMLKVGVRAANLPENEEKAVLIHFLRHNFKEFNPIMINEAFDLALSGKLDLKEVSCYENFSCEYLGRILNAYKQYLIMSGRLKSNLDLERQFKPMDKNLLEAPKMTDDEIVDLSFQLWKPKQNWKFISINAYKALTRQGKIALSEPEKDHFRAAARAEIMNEENKDSDAFRGLDKNYYTQMYAARLATESYFKTLL